MTGKVKCLIVGSSGMRYGFIVPEGKKVDDKKVQVFFHETDVEAGCRVPEKGAEVEYELMPHCDWLRTLSLRPLNKRSYAPVREMHPGGKYGTD